MFTTQSLKFRLLWITQQVRTLNSKPSRKPYLFYRFQPFLQSIFSLSLSLTLSFALCDDKLLSYICWTHTIRDDLCWIFSVFLAVVRWSNNIPPVCLILFHIFEFVKCARLKFATTEYFQLKAQNKQNKLNFISLHHTKLDCMQTIASKKFLSCSVIKIVIEIVYTRASVAFYLYNITIK